MTGSATTYRGFVDESTAMRSASHQEYLIGAALLPVDQIDEVREQLTPLLLPGQIKLHWTDEQPARRRQIVDKICALGSINIVAVMVAGRFLFDEKFSPLRTLGILLVAAGVAVVGLS